MDTYPYTYVNGHTDPHAHAYVNGNTDPHAHAYVNGHTDPHAYTYTSAYGQIYLSTTCLEKLLAMNIPGAAQPAL